MTMRAQQKLQTRNTIIRSALEGLGADRSYGSLSLREVARHAGIAPTSFYRHFKDMDDLGVALVKESALVLKELLTRRVLVQESENITKGSIDVYLSALKTHPQEFRFVMREKSGNSKPIRDAIKSLVNQFTTEYAEFLDAEAKRRNKIIYKPELTAQIIVSLAFKIGCEFLDADESEHPALYQKLWDQMTFVAKGTELFAQSPQPVRTVTDNNLVL